MHPQLDVVKRVSGVELVKHLAAVATAGMFDSTVAELVHPADRAVLPISAGGGIPPSRPLPTPTTTPASGLTENVALRPYLLRVTVVTSCGGVLRLAFARRFDFESRELLCDKEKACSEVPEN